MAECELIFKRGYRRRFSSSSCSDLRRWASPPPHAGQAAPCASYHPQHMLHPLPTIAATALACRRSSWQQRPLVGEWRWKRISNEPLCISFCQQLASTTSASREIARSYYRHRNPPSIARLIRWMPGWRTLLSPLKIQQYWHPCHRNHLLATHDPLKPPHGPSSPLSCSNTCPTRTFLPPCALASMTRPCSARRRSERLSTRASRVVALSAALPYPRAHSQRRSATLRVSHLAVQPTIPSNIIEARSTMLGSHASVLTISSVARWQSALFRVFLKADPERSISIGASVDEADAFVDIAMGTRTMFEHTPPPPRLLEPCITSHVFNTISISVACHVWCTRSGCSSDPRLPSSGPRTAPTSDLVRTIANGVHFAVQFSMTIVSPTHRHSFEQFS